MASWSLALGLLAILQAKPAATAPDSAADLVRLRDGTVVLGQVAESPPRGPLTMYVRRAWAEANVPEQAKRWEEAGKPALRRAFKARRDRLAAWRRERGKAGGPAGDDRIAAWLDRQLAPDGPQDEPPDAPLLVLTINRADVKNVVRRPKATARMLRRGWLSGFRDVETMATADLRSALEDRGFAVDAGAGGEEPVAIDRLLPVPAETDDQWRLRRAATEVSNDSGLRFVQIQSLLMPEPAPGQPLTVDGALAMVSNLAPLLDGKPVDPLAAQLRDVAARGRVGAVVTRQETSPDLDAVRVTIVLWVRNGQDWSPAGSKTATVRTDSIQPGAADDLARDPQLAAVFQVFESIGFGFPPEVKQRSLNVGAATRKALGLARTAFAERLDALALPIDAPPPADGPRNE